MHHLARPALVRRPPAGPAPSRIGLALRRVPLALSLLMLFSQGLRAEIYQWVDRSGSVHFSDNLLSVPPEFRDQIRTRSDRLPPTGPAAEPRAARSPREDVPLEKRDVGYVVRARINGRETCSLVLDTGASSTVLSPRLIARLGIPVQRDPGVVLHTASGEVQAGWAELETLEIGGNTVAPLRVVVHEAVRGADGLLGMNFLGAFHVEILSQGPTLRLKKP